MSATQPFHDLHRIGMLPHRGRNDWRALNDEAGCITGLPASRGHAIATNGVLIAIEMVDGTVYIGHLQYWTPDEKEASKTTAHKERDWQEELEQFV